MNATVSGSKETEILNDIRNSEKKAEEILEKANREKEALIRDAVNSSSDILIKTKEEIRKLQEKKMISARDNAKSIKEEKLEEGKKAVKQLRTKAEKNISKAVDFVMKKFEGMI